MSRKSRIRLFVGFLAVAALVMGCLTGGAATAPASAAGTTAGGLFTPLQAYVLDTRHGVGGYPVAQFAAGHWYSVGIDGQGGVPTSNVAAVQVTFTVANEAGSGVVHADQDGISNPNTTLPYATYGATNISNTAVIPVGADGKIQVELTATADLLVNVQGYFTGGNAAGGGYVAVNATQIYSSGTTQYAAGANVTFPVAGLGGVPANASAVMLDVIETNGGSAAGYLTVYPAGSTKPTSSLNWPGGRNYEWTTSVPMNSTGNFTINIGGASGSVNLSVGVEGYFTASNGTTSAGEFTSASARVFNSTSPSAPIASGASTTLHVAGVAGLPAVGSGIAAVAANIEISPGSGAEGHVQVFADDSTSVQPAQQFYSGVSTFAFDVVSLGADGGITIQNSSTGTINVVIDVEGWYQAQALATPTISCPAPYSNGYVSQTALTSPVVCTVNVNNGGYTSSNGSLDIYVDGVELDAQRFSSGTTSTATVSVPAHGGTHSITATSDSSYGTTGATAAYGFTTPGPSGPTGTAGQFVSAQGRLVDSRVPTGTTKAPFAPSTPRTIQVTGAAGLPSTGVSAVLATFTAVDPTAGGQLTAGPAGGLLSGVMRYDASSPTSNSAIVSVSATGAIQVQVTTTTNVIIDVQGYYTSGNGVTAAGGYSPVAESRVVDTVDGVGLPKATLAGGSTSTVQVTGKANVPAGTAAVFVNFQVVNTNTTAGYINPYATSATSRPKVSLNFDGSPNTSIGAIVNLDSSGAFALYVSAGNTINLDVDVEGYFTAGSSNGTFTSSVGNVYDTRVAPKVAVKPGQTVTVPIGGTNGVPGAGDGLSSVVANLTVVDAGTKGGYARAWADGTTEPAGVSTLTFNPQTAGTMTTNLATVPVGLDGAIEIHNVSADTVNYAVDLEGFYQNTSSTMCANDTDSILGTASTSAATIGADQGAPVVSAVVANSLNDDLNAEVYVVDSSGNPVSGSPVVAGTIDSGEPLIYHLPTGNMTVGSSYTWWVHVYQDDGCASAATTSHHTFTLGTPPTETASTPSTLTISGSSLATSTASSGQTDCGGTPCALTTGSLAIGNDSADDHISAIKADLSGLPAGAQITGATLNITPRCFGSSCMTGTLSIAEANIDITAAATTGADIAAIDTETATTYPEVPGTTSYDITPLVQDWYDGNNDGAVLTESNTNAGATGESFAGPSDSTNPATITISYQAATVPTGVTNLTVTPGDGGLIAAWAEPTSTGWYDNTGASNGISNYKVNVAAGGTTVATQSTPGPRAVLTGLSNGTDYTVTVTPNNPVGAGPTVTSLPSTPAAVTGGPARYISDVQDLLTAQDSLQAGTSLSTQDATTGDTDPTAVSTALGINAATIEDVFTNEADNDESETSDSTALSNTLAVQSGNTVTVYSTATEDFTTVDTSIGAEVDTPGTEVDDDAVQFASSATAPAYLRTLNAAGLIQPVTPNSDDTLSAPPPADEDDTTSSMQASKATVNSSGALFAVGPSAATVQMPAASASRVNQSGTAKWAISHAYWWYWNTIFREDCTDFISRALHYGGGLSEVAPSITKQVSHDDNSKLWYYVDVPHRLAYSKTWSMAAWSYAYQHKRGGTLSSRSTARVGDLVYANFTGGTQGIDHAAIVSKVTGTNIYVAQATAFNPYDPIWKIKNGTSWQSLDPHMTPPIFLDTSNER
jgi:hypothetical protein